MNLMVNGVEGVHDGEANIIQAEDRFKKRRYRWKINPAKWPIWKAWLGGVFIAVNLFGFFVLDYWNRNLAGWLIVGSFVGYLIIMPKPIFVKIKKRKG